MLGKFGPHPVSVTVGVLGMLRLPRATAVSSTESECGSGLCMGNSVLHPLRLGVTEAMLHEVFFFFLKSLLAFNLSRLYTYGGLNEVG